MQPLDAVLMRCNSEIDRMVAGVADRLGSGLDIFDQLGKRLASMSGELVSTEIEQTEAAFLGVVDELRSLREVLVADASDLQAVTRQSDDASKHFERLASLFRAITAVARTARIEAAHVTAGAPSSSHCETFFAEIGTYTDTVKQTIAGCATDHDRLRSLLSQATASQSGFETEYSADLVKVADDLRRAVAHIEQRRRNGVTLIAGAASQASKVTAAATDAIVALQCGDRTRQRIEHVALTLQRFTPDGPGPERDALSYVVRRLSAAQVRDAAGEMAGDLAAVETALSFLAKELTTAIGLGRSLYGGGDGQSASFLTSLETELTRASTLIGRCNTALSRVETVADGLTQFVDRFRSVSTTLTDTVRTIVLIGMNSSLHASRLGNHGRGLVVVAHELKSLADESVDHAKQLLPVFEQMQSATDGLRDRKVGRAGRLTALDNAMHQSLHGMTESASRLDTTLSGLIDDSTSIAAIVDEVRASFATLSQTREALLDAADALDAAAVSPAGGDPDAGDIEQTLADVIMPLYTMERERELHHEVVSACQDEIVRLQSSVAAEPALSRFGEPEILLAG